MSFCVETLQPTRKGYRSRLDKNEGPRKRSGGPRLRQAVILPHTDADVKGRGLSPKARAALGARYSGGALRIQSGIDNSQTPPSLSGTERGRANEAPDDQRPPWTSQPPDLHDTMALPLNRGESMPTRSLPTS